MKKILTTKDLIEKGEVLNKIHEEYKNATPKEKPKKWQDFYVAWQEYRAYVHAYVQTNPIDVSDSL